MYNNKNVLYRFIKFFYLRLLFFFKYLYLINNGNVFNFLGKKDKFEDS